MVKQRYILVIQLKNNFLMSTPFVKIFFIATILIFNLLYFNNAQSGSEPRYKVKGIQMLFPISDGFTISPLNENIFVYSKKDRNMIYQIRKRDIRINEDIPLTEFNDNGPPINLHKSSPDFHPDGHHLIMLIESSDHILPGHKGLQPKGWFTDIWITDINGDIWYNLTHYKDSGKKIYGALMPRISNDGTKIAWGELTKSDPESQNNYFNKKKYLPYSNPFGSYVIKIADLEIDESGIRLKNAKSYRPGYGNFYKIQCWSADDTKLLFASDIDKDNIHKLDLWTFDIVNKRLAHLSNTDDWEEFADYSPNGKKISYVSSRNTVWNSSSNDSIPYYDTLTTELYVMDRNGYNKTRITNINEEGIPSLKIQKYLTGRKIVSQTKWSKDGTSIFFGMSFFNKKSDQLGEALFKLTFREPYGIKLKRKKRRY